MVVCHAGGCAWLLSIVPHIQAEALGVSPQSPDVLRLLCIGHGLWLSSNLIYMRAMVRLRLQSMISKTHSTDRKRVSV